MKPLPEREAEMRATLDPTLPRDEVEEQVADWLRRQPEAEAENRAIIANQINAAIDCLDKAREAAQYNWDMVLADRLTSVIHQLMAQRPNEEVPHG